MCHADSFPLIRFCAIPAVCLVLGCPQPPGPGCTSDLDCLAGQVCEDGECVADEPPGPYCAPELCDDSDPCTIDRCVNGGCQHDSVDPCCGDGSCTGSESCDNCPQDCFCPGCGNGVCEANEDFCDCPEDCESTGCCSDTDCEDDDLCTIDSCIEGECTSAMVVCDDGDACTVDECEGGGCVHTALTCNDDDPCTLDDCGGGECVFTTMECDDGDACTIDECVAGECVFTSIQCGNAPTAQDQVVGTLVNEAIAITLSATDPEGDPLIYSIVDAPIHGALVGEPPGITFAPNQDYVGFDLFSFQADDGRSGALSNTANVRVWVIDDQDLSGQTVNDTIDTASDVDIWDFEGATGQRVLIGLGRTSGPNWHDRYPTFRLYPPGGGGAEDSAVSWLDRQLLNTGQYTIAVESSRPFTWTGSYSLTLLKLEGQLASLVDLDGGPIASDQTLYGTVDTPADIDAFTFDGVANQRILITLARLSGPNWHDRYPRFALYPPDGGAKEDSAVSRMERQLQSTGRYTIIVESSRPFRWTGDYSLTLQQF